MIGILIYNSHNSMLSDNKVPDYAELGIKIEQSNDCYLSGNTIETGLMSGIGVLASGNCTIVSNTIFLDNNYEGIHFVNCWDCKVIGNSISDGHQGILADILANSIFRDNLIFNNWAEGIRFVSECHGCSFP